MIKKHIRMYIEIEWEEGTFTWTPNKVENAVLKYVEDRPLPATNVKAVEVVKNMSGYNPPMFIIQEEEISKEKYNELCNGFLLQRGFIDE